MNNDTHPFDSLMTDELAADGQLSLHPRRVEIVSVCYADPEDEYQCWAEVDRSGAVPSLKEWQQHKIAGGNTADGRFANIYQRGKILKQKVKAT